MTASTIAVLCQLLGHRCDGVDGACTCTCHATDRLLRAIANATD